MSNTRHCKRLPPREPDPEPLIGRMWTESGVSEYYAFKDDGVNDSWVLNMQTRHAFRMLAKATGFRAEEYWPG